MDSIQAGPFKVACRGCRVGLVKKPCKTINADDKLVKEAEAIVESVFASAEVVA